MKINDINKYHQKIGLKEKTIIINKFLNNLDHKLCEQFNLIKLDYPLVFNEDSIFLSKASNERVICFDSYTKENLFFLGGDLSVWLKNKIYDLDCKQNQGVIVFNKKINRDSNSYCSLESNYITIEYVVSEQEILDSKFFDNLLFKIIELIKTSFDEVNPNITKNNMLFKENYIKVAEFHKIRKLFLRKQDIIENFVSKYETVFIKGISELYIDDHNLFNPFREEGESTKEFFFLNKVNKTINSILKIFIRPSYDNLEKQCSLSKLELKNKEFFKRVYEKRTINIEINLNNLYSCAFKEYNNCESSNSCESDEIYRIYNNKKIKVM